MSSPSLFANCSIIGLIRRYHRMVRVEAIMAYGSQGSYLLCVLELHLGPSEGAGLVLKKQHQSEEAAPIMKKAASIMKKAVPVSEKQYQLRPVMISLFSQNDILSVSKRPSFQVRGCHYFSTYVQFQ